MISIRQDWGSLVKTSPVHHRHLINGFEEEKMEVQRDDIRLLQPRSGSEGKLSLMYSSTLLTFPIRFMEICKPLHFAFLRQQSQWKILSNRKTKSEPFGIGNDFSQQVPPFQRHS